MNNVIIRQSENYILTSYGNGIAYNLHNTALDKSVYVQGDDAAQFRKELEARENAFPEKDNLGQMFVDYYME